MLVGVQETTLPVQGPDGTKGNGRPGEAVVYTKPHRAHPCTSACGEGVEYKAPGEPGCGFWDVMYGRKEFVHSDCGFWDGKCGLQEKYEAWKHVLAPDLEERLRGALKGNWIIVVCCSPEIPPGR